MYNTLFYQIHMLSDFLKIFFSFPFKQKFESLYHLIDGERLLLVVVVAASFSIDKLLEHHDTNFSVLFSLFIIKRLKY